MRQTNFMFISFACVSSETHNLQRVFRPTVYFVGSLYQALFSETCGNWA